MQDDGDSSEEVNSQENYDWDNYAEDPSYLDPNLSSPIETQEEEQDTRRQSSTNNQLLEASPRHVVRPFVFSTNPAAPYSTWPPRNPSSEPDFSVEDLLPANLLRELTVSEEDEEVFFDTDNIENTMPPKTPPNPAQMYLDYKDLVAAWDRDHDLAIELGEDLPHDTMEDLSRRFKSLDKLALDIQKLETNHSSLFPDLVTSRNKIFIQRARLQNSFDKRRTNHEPPPDVRNTEEDIDKEVEDSKNKIAILREKLNEAEEDMLKMFSDCPTPSVQDATELRALMDKLGENKDDLHTYTMKVGLLAAKYQDTAKASKIKQETNDDWNSTKDKIKALIRKGREYCSKAEPALPPHSRAGSAGGAEAAAPRSIPLERLPLPSFKGTKMDYLRFKQDFQNHVKYETDGEKMLALKTKCLTKPADKQRIANMMSLAECWEKLDEEYGDIATLVAEVFSMWENLKPPTTDPQFIKFVESIENGVSCLKALGHEKDMDSSYSAVMLEKKLSERLKQEYSKTFVSGTSSTQNRMQTLMSFLKLEKKACHLRTSNYTKVKGDTSDDDPVSSNLTGAEQARERGAGRGRGTAQQGRGRGAGQEEGQGRGKTGGRGAGRPKRGEPNNKCVVCENDHATPSKELEIEVIKSMQEI